jgi:hypothetical protein
VTGQSDFRRSFLRKGQPLELFMLSWDGEIAMFDHAMLAALSLLMPLQITTGGGRGSDPEQRKFNRTKICLQAVAVVIALAAIVVMAYLGIRR